MGAATTKGKLHAEIAAAHFFGIYRDRCHSRFVLCARLCGSGGCLRPATTCWYRIRSRSRSAAVWATSRLVPIRATAGRADIRGAPIRAACGLIPLWATSRRFLICCALRRRQDIALQSNRIRFYKSGLSYGHCRRSERLFERGLCAESRGADRHGSQHDHQADGNAQYGSRGADPDPHLQGGKHA